MWLLSASKKCILNLFTLVCRKQQVKWNESFIQPSFDHYQITLRFFLCFCFMVVRIVSVLISFYPCIRNAVRLFTEWLKYVNSFLFQWLLMKCPCIYSRQYHPFVEIHVLLVLFSKRNHTSFFCSSYSVFKLI